MSRIFSLLLGFLFAGTLCFAQQDSAAVSKSAPALVETKNLSGKVDKEDCVARRKLLYDSAAALQQSHPDLAKGLLEMCKSKTKSEMQNMMQEKNEKEEAGADYV